MAETNDANGTLLSWKEEVGPKKPFHDGLPAEHAGGVAYHGPWADPTDGFNEHVRRCAEALACTGVPVHLREIAPRAGDLDDGVWKRMRRLTETSIARYTVVVKQVVPAAGVLQRLTTHPHVPPALLADMLKSTVISAVWERFPIPKPDVDALNRVGQVWVACSSNADALVKAGVVVPIVVVPIPHRVDDPHYALRHRAKRVPGRRVRFLAIGKWEPRKGMKELIEAFLLAFRPGQAMLTLKTSAGSPKWKTYPPGPQHVVGPLLQHPEVMKNGWTPAMVQKDVYVHQRLMDEQALLDMHDTSDVYVSLSRGEGFNMPAYDAALSGKLLVYVPSGGVEDFACDKDLRVPVHGSVLADATYGWEPGARYLDYRIEDAVAALRSAREKVLRVEPNWKFKDDADAMSYTQVGQTMLAALRRLAPTLGSESSSAPVT